MRLSDIPLFNGTGEQDCHRMIQCFEGKERRYRPGEIICDFGEEHDCVGILVSGSAKIVRLDAEGNQTFLERLEQGSVFGELIAFSGVGDSSIMALCEKEAQVIFVNFYHFSKRCGKACSCHTVVTENMFRMVAEKAYSLSQRVEVLSSRSIREKLLTFFYQQAGKEGNPSFTLPFSMTELADSISVDRSAMTRELKKMKDNGIVRMNGKNITILSK